MTIMNKGRRVVKVLRPEPSEHSFLTGDTLDAIWAYVDARKVMFVDEQGGVWGVRDMTGELIGRISVTDTSVPSKKAITRGPSGRKA